MKPGEIAHSVSRGAFYLALEKVVALFSGIAYFALLLRWLGPTKYGIMTLALSFAGLATMANGNFEVYLERFAAEFQAHGRFATLRRAHLIALSVKFVLGLGAALLLAALAPWLAHHFAMPELATLLPVLTALVVTDSLATTARATLYGLQHFRWVSLLAVVFGCACVGDAGAVDYQRDIQPILTEHCNTCHSTKKQKGDLDLEQFTSVELFETVVPPLCALSLSMRPVGPMSTAAI